MKHIAEEIGFEPINLDLQSSAIPGFAIPPNWHRQKATKMFGLKNDVIFVFIRCGEVDGT